MHSPHSCIVTCSIVTASYLTLTISTLSPPPLTTDVGPVELADRFYYWLDSIGTAAGQRGSVVSAVAEKLNLTFTGLYDPSLYALEEEG